MFTCRYMIDQESAKQVDQRIQKGLFIFACANSCMNPIVYGAFNIRARRGAAQVRPRLNTLNTVQTRVSTPVDDKRISALEISLKPLEWFLKGNKDSSVFLSIIKKITTPYLKKRKTVCSKLFPLCLWIKQISYVFLHLAINACKSYCR